jgi:hypothetical protein
MIGIMRNKSKAIVFKENLTLHRYYDAGRATALPVG